MTKCFYKKTNGEGLNSLLLLVHGPTENIKNACCSLYRNEWLTFHFGVPNRFIHKHSMCNIVPGYTTSFPSLLCDIGPS